MKELNTYGRAVGYLSKIFNLLNAEYFESELSKPTITIQSTPRAYGHFTLREDTWIKTNTGESSHEINIGAGTLARPIEEVCATLLHEMCHAYCYENDIQDVSRGGSYHNRHFKEIAEARDLIIEHDDKYGWTKTSPGEGLLDFCIENQLTDILLMRNEQPTYSPAGGSGTPNGNLTTGGGASRPSSTRKYICPCCGQSVRATKTVKIICGYCNQDLVLA